jgi:hypothetical protein
LEYFLNHIGIILQNQQDNITKVNGIRKLVVSAMDRLKKIYASIIGLIFYVIILMTSDNDLFILFSLPSTIILKDYHGGHRVGLDDISASILSTLWLIFILTSVAYYLYVLIIGTKGQQTSMFIFIFFLIFQLFVFYPITMYSQLNASENGSYGYQPPKSLPWSGLVYLVFGIALDMLRSLARKNNRIVNGTD